MTGDSSDESDETVTIDLYSVEYTVPDDSTDPIVHCFGADPDGQYRHIRVTGFEPYLYVPLTESPSRTEVTASDTMKRLERLNSSGEPHTTPTGTEMMKIVTYTPGDVAEVRDKFENPHESDIVFSQRFLTDMKIRSGMQLPASVVADSEPVHARHIEPVDVNHPWRIHYTDIEVEDRAGFPENGQHPILCITAYDSLEQQYIVWLQGACAKSAADMNPSSDLHDDPVDIRWYESEADMLRSYFAYIRATRPAVMTAWNLPFDAEYLIDRANTLRYDHDTPVGLDQLSPLRHVTNPDSQSTNVKGVEMFDLLTGFKSTQFTELDSYRLDDITAEFLDVSKETYDGTIGDLWETDPEALVSYNIRDVALVVELDRRQDIIPFWRELRSQAVCTLSDATTESTVADRYLLSEYQETVFPNQRSAEADESDFSGGAVMEPIDGIREMVSVLDLASLYPMSMLTLNASPETRVDPDEYDGETITSPNDVHFRTDTEGLTRQMIVSLLSEREEKKQLRSECDPESEQYAVYDRQQRAVKVVMNCFSSDTEVMTPDGPRNIRDVSVGDDVYSINPETKDVEIKPVIDTTAQQNGFGELKHIDTQHTDLKITPNHRMILDDGDGTDVQHFNDLPKWRTNKIPRHNAMDGAGIDTVSLLDTTIEHGGRVWIDPGDEHGRTFRARIPDALAELLVYERNRTAFRLDDPAILHKTGLPDDCTIGVQHGPKHATIPIEYDADNWLKLVAWVITEGSFSQYDTDRSMGSGLSYRGQSQRVSIAQDDGETAAEIGDLLTEMGINYSRNDSFAISNSLLYERLQHAVGKSSASKKIPDWIFTQDLSGEQYQILLHTLIRGDGDSTGPGDNFRYTTQSDELRDDVIELAVRAGYKPQYTRGADDNVWRIYVNQNKGSFKKNQAGTESHDGNVYCITVEDNHTVMAGRNGKLQWTGNTLYGVLSWDQFRLYDQATAAAVTATGRGVLEHTESTVSDESYEVLYGDTDSVMLGMKHVTPTPDTVVTDELVDATPALSEDDRKQLQAIIDESHRLEDVINDSYDTFAENVLGTSDHRFDIEFEKLYQRYFQAGKKKRYAGSAIWKEGNFVDSVDITGFDFVRSDVSAFARELQREVIEMILDGADRQDILRHMTTVLDRWDNRAVSIDDIGVPGGFSSPMNSYDTDIHTVRAAKFGNLLLGSSFSQGAKSKRYYLDGVSERFYDETVPDELDPSRDRLYQSFIDDTPMLAVSDGHDVPPGVTLDWDRMRDKNIRSPMEGILLSLDIDWDELLADGSQTGLHAFCD